MEDDKIWKMIKVFILKVLMEVLRKEVAVMSSVGIIVFLISSGSLIAQNKAKHEVVEKVSSVANPNEKLINMALLNTYVKKIDVKKMPLRNVVIELQKALDNSHKRLGTPAVKIKLGEIESKKIREPAG